MNLITRAIESNRSSSKDVSRRGGKSLRKRLARSQAGTTRTPAKLRGLIAFLRISLVRLIYRECTSDSRVQNCIIYPATWNRREIWVTATLWIPTCLHQRPEDGCCIRLRPCSNNRSSPPPNLHKAREILSRNVQINFLLLTSRFRRRSINR